MDITYPSNDNSAPCGVIVPQGTIPPDGLHQTPLGVGATDGQERILVTNDAGFLLYEANPDPILAQVNPTGQLDDVAFGNLIMFATS